MFDRDEPDEVTDNLPMLAPQVPVQRVQTPYTTAMAVQQKRELPAIEKQSLQEASLLGSDAYYAWGNGKDRVEGPSKELAMCLVRCWGNCAVDLGDVQETRDAWIFRATFVDLETGFTLARQFRQAKGWTVYGRFDEARKDDIRFQIGQSKAVRNVILNALPNWLVAKALDRAKGGVREKIEEAIKKRSLEEVQTEAMKRLAAVQVNEAMVLRTMGRSAVGALTVEDLVILAGNIAAIKQGAATPEELFPPEKESENGPPKTSAQTVAEAAAAKAGKPKNGAATTPAPQPVAAPAQQAPAPAASPAPAPKQDNTAPPPGQDDW